MAASNSLISSTQLLGCDVLHSPAISCNAANISACEVGTAELAEPAAGETVVGDTTREAIVAMLLVSGATLVGELVWTVSVVAVIKLEEEVAMLFEDELVDPRELLGVAVVTPEEELIDPEELLAVAVVTALPSNVSRSGTDEALLS